MYLRSGPVATLAVLGLFVPTLVSAESDTLLGAPRFDNYSEATYKKVAWDDFKGGGQPPPGWNRWSEGSFAHIMCFLRPGAFEFEDREDDGGWVSVPEGIRPYAVMDKFHSAVRPGSRNAGVLAHEQLHFDICELTARHLTLELAAFEGRGTTTQEARIDLDRKLRERLEQAHLELQKLQSEYDSETQNQRNRKKQVKWAAKVDAMFQEATEALTVFLERRDLEKRGHEKTE